MLHFWLQRLRLQPFILYPSEDKPSPGSTPVATPVGPSTHAGEIGVSAASGQPLSQTALDPAKVNVNGGAMALGHPIAATGSILIGTVLDELERRDLNTGLVTMCTGGGMAPAIIIERV